MSVNVRFVVLASIVVLQFFYRVLARHSHKLFPTLPRGWKRWAAPNEKRFSSKAPRKKKR
jgi:hypothetical protein